MSAKIKLEDLQVDSFATEAEDKDSRGTVMGYVSVVCATRVDATCNGYGTCGIYPCKQIP